MQAMSAWRTVPGLSWIGVIPRVTAISVPTSTLVDRRSKRSCARVVDYFVQFLLDLFGVKGHIEKGTKRRRGNYARVTRSF